MALGCSTNTILHLPAIAFEGEIELDLADINAISDRTPQICKLSPAVGGHYLVDLNEAGGISAVLKSLLDRGLIDGSVMTVSGCSMAKDLLMPRLKIMVLFARWITLIQRKAD
jgi:dihydroxy-acid dehydratase